MPRKRRPKPAGRPKVPPAFAAEYEAGSRAAPPANEWGYEVTPATLPPLPPVMAATSEQASPPPESLVANGPPPADARGAQAWGFRALMLQAHDAMVDGTISSAARRKEVRVILAAAAKLYPDAARAEVANTIDEDRRELVERKRANARAKLEARPPAGNAKVIPIRRDG